MIGDAEGIRIEAVNGTKTNQSSLYSLKCICYSGNLLSVLPNSSSIPLIIPLSRLICLNYLFYL